MPPLFCDTDLARRIERAESELITDGNRAARRRRLPAAPRRRRRELRRRPVTGDVDPVGSPSQRNVQRRGFDLLYTRAVLVR